MLCVVCLQIYKNVYLASSNGVHSMALASDGSLFVGGGDGFVRQLAWNGDKFVRVGEVSVRYASSTAV